MMAPLKRALRGALTPAARAIRQTVLPRVFPTPAHRWPGTVRHIRVVGLLSSASGLGKSGRLCGQKLRQAGYRVSGADVADLYNSNDGVDVTLPDRPDERPAASIYHLNPPMLLPGIIRSNPVHFWRGYNIGYWAWELEVLPREWIKAIDVIDALMVPSTFCKAAIERHTDKPVLVVPHPVAIRAAGAEGAAPPRPATGPFRVVSIFNFGSSFERKNPLAAIAAFRRAFGEDRDVELVLKVGDGVRYPADRDRLRAAIAGSANIRLVDDLWDEARLTDLLASADAYLSLHRSEGFGLTLAEAIAAGVPVVATNWSGNLDFCRPDLCFPVDCTLVPLQDSHLSFRGMDGAMWAEPSVEHAAFQLRSVRNDPEAARAKARLLREHLRVHLEASTYEAALAALSREPLTGRRQAVLAERSAKALAGR